MNAIKKYIKTSFQELSRVTWPTKSQAIRLTVIVLIFCIVTAFLLGALDYGFNELYHYVLSQR